MPKLAANLATLFTGLPFIERFRAAKDAGFDAVEVPFPYDHPTQEIRDALVWNDLAFVLMNCPPPNATGGPQGFAAVPGLEDRFRRDFDRTLRFAQVLKPRHIHILSGPADGPEAEATFVANLRWAAARAPALGLTIGPVERTDPPGSFLADFDSAARVRDAVAAANLGLQFDTGLARRRAGDPAGPWAAHGAHATHVRIAGLPGQLDAGADAFLARLDAEGYAGWVSVDGAQAGA